jgi:poly(beta-D-mannuronate) lyase
MKKILLTLILTGIIPIMLFSAVYTVGSETEIEAIKSLNAGDTVKVEPGYYSDVLISFSGAGALGDSVVFMAEEPGSVILNGRSKLLFSGQYIKISGLFFVNGYSTSGNEIIEFRRSNIRANNCRVTNCAIMNYNPPSKDTDYKWLSMFGKNNRVDHCHFEGKIHSGTTFVVWLTDATMDRPNNHRIDHNYFGPRPDLGYNGGETIRIGTSDYSLTNSQTIVEYNVFDQCNGETEIISNKSCENIYRHNTFLECQGTLTLRHGRRCLVDGNFFFGNNQNNTGGIRIIGEDHVVINNYLQDLTGAGYKTGICIVRGVENSPLYRYFPVKRAIIANNTLVNVRYPININYAASDDQTVAPDSCVIVNNAVDAGSSNDVLEIYGTPTRFVWAGNIFFGDQLGAPDPGGILWTDPMLTVHVDDLFRPGVGSPLIDAGVSGYYVLSEDVDGQTRATTFDVGADEVSTEPVKYHPLYQEDVGPSWNVELEKVTVVEAGENTLQEALDRVAPGDTLKLITRAGNYSLTADIEIENEVVLLSDYEGDDRPVIYCTSSDPVFTLKNKAKLYLNNLKVDAYTSSGSKSALISSATYTSGLNVIRLVAKNCLFSVTGVTLPDVSCLEIDQFVRADSIHFKDCEFRGFTDVVLDLDDVIAGSADFRAEDVVIETSTFWNNTAGVLSIDAGDAIPFTLGPKVIIDQCTIDDCADADKITLDLKDVDAAEVHNTIISNSSSDTASISLYGWGYIDYSNLYASGNISQYRGGNINDGMKYVNPAYADEANGDFTLPWQNALLTASESGSAIGDPRWVLDYTPIIDESADIPQSMSLDVYPNPTNANINIDYEFLNSNNGVLLVYDINGALYRSILLDNGRSSMNLDLNDLSSGIWFIRLSNGNESLTRKIMVLK